MRHLESAPAARERTRLTLLGQASVENETLRQENQRLATLVESQRLELAHLRTSKLLLENMLRGVELIAGRPAELHSVRVDQ